MRSKKRLTILKEIWKMSEEDKCKAIKRLYLRWHPDKNLDNTKLFNEAFKYLQKKINELEGGKTAGSTSSGGDHFRESWSRWMKRPGRHRGGESDFIRTILGGTITFGHILHRGTCQIQTFQTEKKLSAGYRQAECDLSAAQSEPAASPEWNLFKVHQAVEKSPDKLRAVASSGHFGCRCQENSVPKLPSTPPPYQTISFQTFEDGKRSSEIAEELLKNVEKIHY
uniref:J domain-containing protein n=1 Tax=Astyanax mexicanus TaxID=7994 RepID=A0A3B1JUV4_ASTMX